ncbi:hypothetical protein COT82_00560 [Candidatus Campbellbacteria bacterium CG10_big_fil_rev_8_21_14_0_10_35_52]|uniref:Uncharacterized protein n=1 Tax=Candidatus Campbellbacteria bacterium CG10_big_fil_rev_8_21_14_0_10_35_52 TaxID=1974527 RepID=A0A2M6WVV8_9BACT|nr:MAG: hypothetical protein COT82_00560 [Candidatus Campbellbacteria bacterium CG10_big_fil_rev_8_21_14_0_10_35_52]
MGLEQRQVGLERLQAWPPLARQQPRRGGSHKLNSTLDFGCCALALKSFVLGFAPSRGAIFFAKIKVVVGAYAGGHGLSQNNCFYDKSIV